MSRIDTQPPLNLALVAALFPAGDRREVRNTATQAAQTVRAGSGLESDKQLAYAIIQMASQAAAADVEMTLQEALDKVLKQEEIKHARADEQRALLLAGGALQQVTGAHTTQFASTPVTKGPAADVVANAPVVAPVADEVEEPAVAEGESMEPSVDAMIAFGGASEADQVAARINEAVKRAEDQAREMAAADAEIKRLEESIAAIEAGAPFIEVESVPPVEDSGTLPSWLIRTAHAPELPEAAVPAESADTPEPETAAAPAAPPAGEALPERLAAPEPKTPTPAPETSAEPTLPTPAEPAPAEAASEPAPAPTPAPAPAVAETDPAAEATTHTVQGGDTLTAIVAAHYGLEGPELVKAVSQIAHHNGITLAEAGHIEVGQEIELAARGDLADLPLAEPGAAPSATEAHAAAAAPAAPTPVVPVARPTPAQAEAPAEVQAVVRTEAEIAAIEEVVEHLGEGNQLTGSFLVATDNGWFSKPTISLVTTRADGTLQVIANPTAAQAQGASFDDSAEEFLRREFNKVTSLDETQATLSLGDNMQVHTQYESGFFQQNMGYTVVGP